MITCEILDHAPRPLQGDQCLSADDPGCSRGSELALGWDFPYPFEGKSHASQIGRKSLLELIHRLHTRLPMTENLISTDVDQTQKRSPLLMIGSIMWVLCLVAICYSWYVWRERVLASKVESDSVERLRQIVRDGQENNPPQTDDDDGKPRNSIKLVPQKDGSFVAKAVTKDEEANPWDAEGIEDFSFTDTDGRTVTKNDLLGKPFIIAFVFTMCRGPCPNVTLQMRELQDRLKDYDFNLVTLTVDPDRDTMETLEVLTVARTERTSIAGSF